MIDKNTIAGMIDQVALGPIVREADVKRICDAAKKYRFKGVAVPPSFISTAVQMLKGSTSIVVAPVGFPHGNLTSHVKLLESEEAIRHGAQEIDVVMNLGKFKDHNYSYVLDELAKIVLLDENIKVKVIIEGCYLNNDELREACKLVIDSGAEFIKTSTGFGEYGATFEMVQIIAKYTKGKIKIKAAGGISTVEQIEKYIALGVERFGTSNGVKIINSINNTITEGIV
mgnify:CR=1 FL=1